MEADQEREGEREKKEEEEEGEGDRENGSGRETGRKSSREINTGYKREVDKKKSKAGEEEGI